MPITPFQVRLGTTSAIASGGSGTEGSNMVTLPISSTYKTTSTTIVDSSRNGEAIMIGSVIRAGIRKIEMSWLVISIQDYAKLGTFFNSNFMFYAYYFDQDTNSWLTKHFYVGDRVADALKNEQWALNTGAGGGIAPKHIENLKLSFIEV